MLWLVYRSKQCHPLVVDDNGSIGVDVTLLTKISSNEMKNEIKNKSRLVIYDYVSLLLCFLYNLHWDSMKILNLMELKR